MNRDDFMAGVRDRLGMTDADASGEAVLSALDEALAETADPIQTPVAALPEGMTVIDTTVLDELRQNAARGAEARAEQDRSRRDSIVSAALTDGRITAASRDTWRARLDEDEAGTVELLNTLATNTVPVAEIGHSDTVTSADDALYASAWGAEEKGA